MAAVLRGPILLLFLLLPGVPSAAGDVARGEYLTTILGCGGCHTEGALMGRQTGEWLAGSRIGVAWSNPEHGDHPAVVFPANLTPDRATGLGTWSEREIARAIRTGVGHAGKPLIPVMPWPNYSLLTAGDARAIAAYLKSLPAVEYRIPAPVAAGTASTAPYLRVGMFFFDPASAEQSMPAIEDDAPPAGGTPPAVSR